LHKAVARGSAYDCAPQDNVDNCDALNIQLQQTHKKIMGLKWLGERGRKIKSYQTKILQQIAQYRATK